MYIYLFVVNMHAELLGIDDIREVIDRLWDYRAKWRFIGVELRIKPGDLDAIGENNRAVEGALFEMIKFWLHSINPRPTRTVLEAALQSRLLVAETVSTQEAVLQSRFLVTEGVSSQEGCIVVCYDNIFIIIRSSIYMQPKAVGAVLISDGC